MADSQFHAVDADVSTASDGKVDLIIFTTIIVKDVIS